MLGSDFYVYENIGLFQDITKLYFDDVRFNQRILDFYTWADKNGKDHLVVITNYVKEDIRPDFEKTVIFLHGDNTKKFLSDMEGRNLVKWNEVVFSWSGKEKDPIRINFGKKSKWFGLRKIPIISFPVILKSIHPIKNKTPINGLWAYDSVRDRINLIQGRHVSEFEN